MALLAPLYAVHDSLYDRLAPARSAERLMPMMCSAPTTGAGVWETERGHSIRDRVILQPPEQLYSGRTYDGHMTCKYSTHIGLAVWWSCSASSMKRIV